eukprot:c18124_g1_i1.p1 GENE.c18124_g1_i1~~c18124_g1_i1.p1  ORF type:complete len:254 (+),score=100.48 c18124_g1_i1:44-763(+)
MSEKKEENSEQETDVVKNLKTVISAIDSAKTNNQNVRLVAVSKKKPNEAIQKCYDVGHRHFGENYVQELVDKAEKLPNDIHWHFIGHLQTNKCKALAKIKNLWTIETIDSSKLAEAMNKALEGEDRKEPLSVFVQVNTSKEESKSGCTPEECTEIVSFIKSNCSLLKFVGLMTIGSPSGDPNNDFQSLVKCKERVCEQFNISEKDVELSMGMSSDFEAAIRAGSTNIRIGSTIFGHREQ